MAASTGVAGLRRGGVETGGPLWSPAVLPWLWTGALALVVQLLLIKVVARETSPPPLIVWVVFASHLLLIPFLLRNEKYWGIKLILLGLSLNLLAMASNGGMMPASAGGIAAVGQQNTLVPGDRVVGSKDVYSANPRMPLLADRIILRLPGDLVRVVSIGDIVISLGMIGALATVSRKVLMPTGDDKALRPVARGG